MDILLSGFSSRSDFASIFEKEVVKITYDDVFDDIDLTYINKLFDLNHRMVRYLHTATVIHETGGFGGPLCSGWI